MAITSVGPFWIGMPPSVGASAPQLAGPITIDAATEKIAFCFKAPKTGTQLVLTVTI